MISFFVKFKNIILIAIIACFLGSLGYVGVGALKEEYGPNAPVAKVGEDNIKYRDYERLVKNIYETLQSEETEEADNLRREQIRQQVLNSLIYESALKQEAQKMGLGVSDMEVAYFIKNDPLFNTTGSFNKDNYLWIIRNRLGMNAAEYEQSKKDSRLAQTYQTTMTLVAKVSPQEEDFVKKTVLKGEQADDLQIAANKAQALISNFSQDFYQRNRVSFTQLAPSYQAE